MKFLYTLSFFLFSFAATAQTDWWCVLPTAKNYFTNDNHYLRGIRVDSQKNAGPYTILYPFRSPRGYYLNNQVLKPSGCWLGDTIIIGQDGMHYFDNYWGDTVVIKTQAGLNDSWIFYDDTTADSYIATVTATDTATVLGSLDSIKEITLTALNGQSINTADPLHNAKLVISKTHGFVQAFDLYIFPMHEPGQVYQPGFDFLLDRKNTMSNLTSNIFFKLSDFYNPDMQELNTYNKDDIFEYSEDEANAPYGNSGKYLMLDEIHDKVYKNQDIVYTIYRWKETHNWQPPYTTTVASVFEKTISPGYLFNLDKKMPEEWEQDYIYYYDPVDTSFCEVNPFYTEVNNDIRSDGTIDKFLSLCPYSSSYKIGFGFIEHIACFEPSPGNQMYQHLVYVKKDNQPCRQFYTLDINPIENLQKIVSIFPNPASETINITLPGSTQTSTISLYNAIGRLIKQIDTKESSLSIDVSAIPAGLYYMNVSANGVQQNEKVSIAH